MNKQNLMKALTVAMALGVLLLAVPSVTQAATITSVSVTITYSGGTRTWCDTTGSCAFKIWNLGGGVNLTPLGSTLVLTQGQLANAYNFDTSDSDFGLGNFVGSAVITINGVNFSDTPQALTDKNANNLNPTHNEAVNWTSVGTTSGISLSVGYADTAHLLSASNNCADNTDNNCLPNSPANNVWGGTLNTAGPAFFLGSAVSGGCSINGVITSLTTTCFDSGALLITTPAATPEPSVLLTLGSGLLGIALLSRKLAKSKK